MWAKVSNERRSQRALMRFAVVVSLDALIQGESSGTLQDLIPWEDNGFDEVHSQDMLERVKSLLSERQAAILDLRIAGYAHSDIAKIKNISMNASRKLASSVKHKDGISQLIRGG